MKKFKPTNGSYSQLYGEQSSIEDKKQNYFYGKMKVPDFSFKSKSHSKSRLNNLRLSSLGEE